MNRVPRARTTALGDFIATCTLIRRFTEGKLLLGKIWHRLGWAHHADDFQGRAREIFADLYAEAPPEEKDELALWIAMVYDSLGDSEKPAMWVARLGDPSIKLRAEAYLRLEQPGRLKEAIVAGEEAVARDPKDPVARLVIASALLRDLGSGPPSERWRKHRELLRLLEKTVELHPEDEQARRGTFSTEAWTSRRSPGSWGMPR